MSTSNKIAKTALAIVIITLVSKLLGFVRETLIAAKFGSGMETDTFFVALTVTTLITNLIGNALSTTLIPVLSEVEIKEGKEGKINHTNNMINVIFLISIVLAVITWFSSPIIVRLTAKGFQGEQYNLAVKLTRMGTPMILFSGLIGSLTGYLQSKQRHMSSAAIGFPFNLVYIFYLVLLSSRFGIEGLMVAAVFAILSQLLIQIPEARKAGYKYKFILDVKDSYIRKALSLSIPVIIGVAINDVNAIIDRTLASDLVTGSISALNYGNKLNGLVLSIFVSAVTTVIFPLLSKESNKGNIDGIKRIMGEGINLILIITIPTTVGLFILAKPIIEVVFERGAFTADATVMAAQALKFYALGLIASSLQLLLTRVYYSLQNTKMPMIAGVLSVGINVILNLILVRYMAHGGLALATSIAITIATLFLFYSLKQKIGSLGTIEYIKCGIKSGVASSIMGLVAYTLYHGLYSKLRVSKLFNLISLVAAVGVAVIVYIILCYLLRIKEIRAILNKLKLYLKHRK